MATEVLLTDYEDTAPPEKVLRLTCIGGKVFIDICKYEEDYTNTKMESLERMAFHAVDFANALNTVVTEDLNSVWIGIDEDDPYRIDNIMFAPPQNYSDGKKN